MVLAARVAKTLRSGDCLALVGDLGSGKTTFVRGLARGLGLGRKDCVSSPTFVILKNYPTKIPLHHFDVYRLTSEGEFLGAGLEEFLGGEGVCVIEWADKMEGLLPQGHIRIEFFAKGPSRRRIVVHHKLFRKRKERKKTWKT